MSSFQSDVLRAAVLTALSGLVSQPAHGDPEFTISLGANYSKADAVPNPYIDSALQHTISTTSYSGIAPRIAFRIDWPGRASVEAGWSRFGSESGTITFPPPPSPCAPVCPGPEPNPPPGPPRVHAAEQTGQAMWIALTPKIIDRDWDMRVKLGLARVTRDTDVSPFDNRTLEKSTTDLMIGLSVGWPVSDRFGVMLDLDSFGGRAIQAGLSVTYGF